MKKKVISTVLCAAMVASMFAGCGNKAADNSSAADNSAADNRDRKSTRLNSSHKHRSRMPSSA